MRVNATVDEDLLRRVDAFAKARYEDRSTAIRQLLDFALRELAQAEAIQAYQGGRLTLREFGRALGLDVWGAHDLLAARGVPVAQGVRAESGSGLEELIQSVTGRRPGEP